MLRKLRVISTLAMPSPMLQLMSFISSLDVDYHKLIVLQILSLIFTTFHCIRVSQFSNTRVRCMSFPVGFLLSEKKNYFPRYGFSKYEATSYFSN